MVQRQQQQLLLLKSCYQRVQAKEQCSVHGETINKKTVANIFSSFTFQASDNK